MESRFDSLNKPRVVLQSKRTMAPKLLEFATLPNFLHHTETVDSISGWPWGYDFMFTAQPYLEITYTKHEGPMRPDYNLRCFEHVYEQGPRFQLAAPVRSFESPSSLQRVTTRLLSLPTKIYVWAELADEYKHAFIWGGVRRSCRLENIHLRVNQRPDVMFNPSQEDCYEMFKRHTNSSLEFGSWLKSPIYCFDMVDVGQPDMFSNDARITWFEWDAEVKLTELQMVEHGHVTDLVLDAMGYIKGNDDLQDNFRYEHPELATPNMLIYGAIDYVNQRFISSDDTDFHMSLLAANQMNNTLRQSSITAAAVMRGVDIRLVERAHNDITSADFRISSVHDATMELDGYIWAIVATTTIAEGYLGAGGLGAQNKGDIYNQAFWYIPNSWRFHESTAGEGFYENLTKLNFAQPIKFNNPEAPVKIIKGVLAENENMWVGPGDGKCIGIKDARNGAKWAPGPFGYRISGLGIANDTLYGFPHGITSLPQVDETVPGQAWVCFAPQTVMPHWNGADVWNKNIHTFTEEEVEDSGAPLWYGAQTAGGGTQWENGFEVVNLSCVGTWGTKDPEVFNDLDVRYAPDDSPYGCQLVRNNERVGEYSKDTEYRLKTLYEYGNCQYNFRQDAAPTRVLPNVVPVGPSPGIPLGL